MFTQGFSGSGDEGGGVIVQRDNNLESRGKQQAKNPRRAAIEEAGARQEWVNGQNALFFVFLLRQWGKPRQAIGTHNYAENVYNEWGLHGQVEKLINT